MTPTRATHISPTSHNAQFISNFPKVTDPERDGSRNKDFSTIKDKINETQHLPPTFFILQQSMDHYSVTGTQQ
jgi:hypothetical protein